MHIKYAHTKSSFSLQLTSALTWFLVWLFLINLELYTMNIDGSVTNCSHSFNLHIAPTMQSRKITMKSSKTCKTS